MPSDNIAETITIGELNRQAWVLLNSDPAQALTLAQQVRARSALEGDAVGELVSTNVISRALLFLGHVEQALVTALDARRDLRAGQAQDPLAAAKLIETLGVVYDALGDYPRTLDSCMEYIACCEALGEQALLAQGILRVGFTHSNMGEYRVAIEFYDRAVALLEQAGHRRGLSRAFNSYCVDYTYLGEYERAIEYGQRSLALMYEVGDHYGAGVVLSSLGQAYSSAGQYDVALDHFQRALELLRGGAGGAELSEGLETLVLIGQLHLKRGEPDQTIALLAPLLENLAIQQHPQILADVHRALADGYELAGRPTDALEHFRRYAASRESILNERSVEKYQQLAVVYRTQQAVAEAERERKLREEQRRHFDTVSQMQAEFVRVASHDLKSPLSVITSGTELIDLLDQLDPDGQHVLQLIQHAAGRMNALIGDMLDLLKLETGHALQLRPLALLPLLQEVLADAALQAQVEQHALISELPPAELLVHGDRDKLRRVLENLLSNAIKYTPTGGQVHLRVAEVAGQAVICVEDTGIGIPEPDLPHIFDTFYRVKAMSHHGIAGTGLGLAIVRSIVEQHGGAITVSSTLGQGSTFEIRLPLA